MSNSIGGALEGTEWGMVLLGIFLGAGLALMVAYTYFRVSGYRYGGVAHIPHCMGGAYGMLHWSCVHTSTAELHVIFFRRSTIVLCGGLMGATEFAS